MKYIRLENNKVVETISFNPAGLYHESIIWHECPNESVEQHWTTDGLNFYPPEVIETPDVPVTTEEADEITQAAILAARRAAMVVTRRQARLVLLQQGLLDDVEAAINAIEDETTRREVQIEWEYAMDIRRDWPALQLVTQQLGITEEQLDQMFLLASEI